MTSDLKNMFAKKTIAVSEIHDLNRVINVKIENYEVKIIIDKLTKVGKK